jgi:predicted branched-subunit amino acid permease
MFLGLLVYQLKGSLIILISAISGVLSVIFCLMLPGAWYVILSSIIAATIGVVIARSDGNSRKEGKKKNVS